MYIMYVNIYIFVGLFLFLWARDNCIDLSSFEHLILGLMLSEALRYSFSLLLC